MADDQRSADDILNNVPEDSGMTAKDAKKSADGGVRKPIPKGDYKVVCTDYNARENNSKEEGVANHINISLKLEVLEPEQFKGKIIWHDLRLYARGEKGIWRDKRVATITGCEFVSKADLESEDATVKEAATAKLRKFDFRVFKDHTFVYRCGQVKLFSVKVGDWVVYNEAGDFVGLHPEKKWDDQEWINRAPSKDQTPRVVEKAGAPSAASAAVNTGTAQEDIDIDDEEC